MAILQTNTMEGGISRHRMTVGSGRVKRGVFLTNILLLTLLFGMNLASAESYSASLAANGSPTQALELLGRWHHGPVYSSAVSGDHVFFGSGGAIRVLETNEHTSIWQEVASINSSGVVRGLSVSGSHLYVADDSGALIVIDISDPRNPTETGRAELFRISLRDQRIGCMAQVFEVGARS